MLHHAIPTNSLRHHHNLAQSAGCTRSNVLEESISHLFRDCPISKQVWNCLGLVDSGISGRRRLIFGLFLI